MRIALHLSVFCYAVHSNQVLIAKFAVAGFKAARLRERSISGLVT